jgi:pantothenate synthetase
MSELEKAVKLLEEAKANLRTVRDLRALAKSTKKNKLTKIERHAALLVDLYQDLIKAYQASNK